MKGQAHVIVTAYARAHHASGHMVGPMPYSDHGFSKFIQLLVSRGFPAWLRYGGSVALVGFFVALRLSLPLDGIRFVLFIPAVLGASLAFGRGPGLLATALTTAASVIWLIEPRNSFLIPANEIFSVMVYVAIGCGIALLCHVLRTTMHRALSAERSKTVLLEELAHRTKNDLQMVASLLSLQARALSEPVARAAIEGAAARVLAVAKLHNRLRSDGQQGVVDIRDYLDDLCGDLRQTFGEFRPVTVRLEADRAVVRTAVAAPIGLMVNELVTNAFKHAFPDNRPGVIEVTFRRAAPGFVLTVHDDGIGRSDAKDGLGSRLIRLLAQQVGGEIDQTPSGPGATTTITLPGP